MNNNTRCFYWFTSEM